MILASKETVRLSRVNGVAVKMITGDHLLIALETSRVLDMGGIIQSAEGLPLLDKETKSQAFLIEVQGLMVELPLKMKRLPATSSW